MKLVQLYISTGLELNSLKHILEGWFVLDADSYKCGYVVCLHVLSKLKHTPFVLINFLVARTMHKIQHSVQKAHQTIYHVLWM